MAARTAGRGTGRLTATAPAVSLADSDGTAGPLLRRGRSPWYEGRDASPPGWRSHLRGSCPQPDNPRPDASRGELLARRSRARCAPTTGGAAPHEDHHGRRDVARGLRALRRAVLREPGLRSLAAVRVRQAGRCGLPPPHRGRSLRDPRAPGAARAGRLRALRLPGRGPAGDAGAVRRSLVARAGPARRGGDVRGVPGDAGGARAAGAAGRGGATAADGAAARPARAPGAGAEARGWLVGRSARRLRSGPDDGRGARVPRRPARARWRGRPLATARELTSAAATRRGARAPLSARRPSDARPPGPPAAAPSARPCRPRSWGCLGYGGAGPARGVPRCRP